MGERKISDEAMVKATGKGPDHWFPILDEMSKEHEKRSDLTMSFWKAHETEMSAWWAQMTTVEWERDRGKRTVNQDCTGTFQMSAQKTFAGNENAAWEKVSGTDWLDGLVYEEGAEFETDGIPITVRAVRPGKLLRLWWHADEGRSTVEVMFFPKGEKCAVRFQHQQLPTEADVAVFKTRWKEALGEIFS